MRARPRPRRVAPSRPLTRAIQNTVRASQTVARAWRRAAPRPRPRPRARSIDARALGAASPRARARTRAAIATDAANKTPGRGLHQHSVVMKFGGSSVADAARMREVAQIVLSFPEEMPVLVLSAMGKTTNNLLAAGEMAMRAEEGVEALEPLRAIRRLHEDTMEALGTDAVTKAEVQKLLKKLEQVCTGIALMQEVTSRTRALLVSFGERMSTRIFASYLRSLGARTEQVDTIDDMFVTTDEFEIWDDSGRDVFEDEGAIDVGAGGRTRRARGHGISRSRRKDGGGVHARTGR